ncbi:5'/3'-nucleotidase SurE [Chloroflexota bacterium]
MMKILLTNDDGIFAEGLWQLADELRSIAQVVIAAPDREQSAAGTAVTLSRPLRVRKIKPLVPEVEAYSIEGTPSDSVILALEKLTENGIDLVISGPNQGFNLGNDVLISGTVGAALQGYLRGYSALAISIPQTENPNLQSVGKLAALLAKKIGANTSLPNIFLNVNMPELPPKAIKGVNVTRLASETHIDTVEEGHDGRRSYYWLVRKRIPDKTHQDVTDIWAVEHGHISITPLHIYQNGDSTPGITDSFCAEILEELRKNQE